MIVTVEIPNSALLFAPAGQARFVLARYIRGVARQIEDNLDKGQVAIDTDGPLADWQLFDPADTCEGVAQ